MNLRPEELATVLAALRCWQRNLGLLTGELPEWSIATNEGTVEPLDESAIDSLCERLNAGDEAPRNLPDDDYVLTDEAAWFTVRNISVRITAFPMREGVHVWMYSAGRELDNPLDSVYVEFANAELPVTPLPSAINYDQPPTREGAPGTLTAATARAGMRVYSVLHEDDPSTFVVVALNDDGRTMRIAFEGTERIVDNGCTPINRMYPARGESLLPPMTLGES